MSINTYLLLVSRVVLTALAQITLKAGMSTGPVQSAVGHGTMLDMIAAVGRSPAIAVGFALYGCSIALWLVVLARIEVSRAYPFVGFGMVLTMAFGWLLLGESLGPQKIIGTLLVAAGVYLVANA